MVTNLQVISWVYQPDERKKVWWWQTLGRRLYEHILAWHMGCSLHHNSETRCFASRLNKSSRSELNACGVHWGISLLVLKPIIGPSTCWSWRVLSSKWFLKQFETNTVKMILTAVTRGELYQTKPCIQERNIAVYKITDPIRTRSLVDRCV